MRHKRLGKTGLEVSAMGFGGIPIMRVSTDEAVKVVRRCIELGVNFIDTANGYLDSEEKIGLAIEGNREKVIVATKSTRRDTKGVLEHLELSLTRLRTDYIDLFQFHNISRKEDFETITEPGGALEAIREAKESGKIRHIGVSSHSRPTSIELVKSGLFETIQFPFNFVAAEAAEDLIPTAVEHDVGFIAMKPMGGGMLHDAQVAFRYVTSFESVVPIPGFETVEEVEEAVQITEDLRPMTSEEKQRMEAIRAELGTRFCRRCGYCQPCPEGIAITTVMVIESFAKRMPRDRVLAFAGKAMETAKNCTECKECEERCPYHLPIAEMLKENIAFFEKTFRDAA